MYVQTRRKVIVDFQWAKNAGLKIMKPRKMLIINKTHSSILFIFQTTRDYGNRCDRNWRASITLSTPCNVSIYLTN